jgi:hypothetical protein
LEENHCVRIIGQEGVLDYRNILTSDRTINLKNREHPSAGDAVSIQLGTAELQRGGHKNPGGPFFHYYNAVNPWLKR